MTDISTLLETPPSKLTLGQCVDAYKELNAVRLLMQKETEAVEAVEKAFKQHLIDNLSKQDEKGVFGLKYKAQHKTKRIPRVDNDNDRDGWRELHEHIYNTGDFGLLQKRLNDKAVMDQIEAGVAIPGVTTMLVSEISVTKIA